jgi:hypothetical protein
VKEEDRRVARALSRAALLVEKASEARPRIRHAEEGTTGRRRGIVDRVRRAASALFAASLLTAGAAFAEEPEPAPPSEVRDAPKGGKDVPDLPPPADESTAPVLPAPPEEAPPLPPRKNGFVLESSLGAVGFMGQFRHVAPTALWLHTQFGYEPLDWLMVFADGELLYTDTSEAQDPTKSRAFPVFGFGAGLRFTIHATPRFAVFAQASLGALKADIPQNALAILGYRSAESLNLSFGGRIGLEWYQIDRHLALGLAGGLRDATGFAKAAQRADLPLFWDAAASIRYTF